jgi:hypothetical protein
MNSYILYEFISPGDLSFHAYEFICIRWYIKKWWLTEELWRWMADRDDCERLFGPWFKSPPGYNFFLIFMLLLF